MKTPSQTESSNSFNKNKSWIEWKFSNLDSDPECFILDIVDPTPNFKKEALELKMDWNDLEYIRSWRMSIEARLRKYTITDEESVLNPYTTSETSTRTPVLSLLRNQPIKIRARHKSEVRKEETGTCFPTKSIKNLNFSPKKNKLEKILLLNK